jgi:hypothetical protein
MNVFADEKKASIQLHYLWRFARTTSGDLGLIAKFWMARNVAILN